eukprot:1666152-Pyramimonas_sp.AAC.1
MPPKRSILNMITHDKRRGHTGPRTGNRGRMGPNRPRHNTSNKLPCDVPNPFVSMDTRSWPKLVWAINLMCKLVGRRHCAGPRKQASKVAT